MSKLSEIRAVADRARDLANSATNEDDLEEAIKKWAEGAHLATMSMDKADRMIAWAALDVALIAVERKHGHLQENPV